jgi:radical SAM protein with 4Fe4S-binding SPASM domain
MYSYLTNPQKYWFDGNKLIYFQDRLKDFLDGKRVMPITLDAGIHKGCNIRCKFCYGIKQGKNAKFIPKDRLMLLAEDMAECGVKAIAIIGDGEPTLNPGLCPFVTKLRNLGVDPAVATNGLLLDKEKIDILTSSLTWMRFNISGVDKYESIMGAQPGSFAKFERVVRQSVDVKRKCTIGLQMVLIPDAFSEVIPLARKAVEWGVDYLVIKQFSDGGAGMPMHFDMDEYSKVEGDLKIAEALSTDRTSIIVKWSAIADSKSITKENKWKFDRCLDLPFIFQVSGDGGCYPCGYHFGNPEYCYGSLIDSRLKDILHSDRYWDIVKKCADTPLDKLCTGQCRHCSSLDFLDKVVKGYKGDLTKTLVDICGNEANYNRIMDTPPEHLNFV